jgi:enediyne biosynthesis protein E4
MIRACRFRLLAGVAMAALWVACAPEAAAPSRELVLPAAAPGPRFIDRTDESGLSFEHVSGSPEQRYILESMAAGAAFFDADGDQDLDLFIVNSSRVPGPAPGVSNRLFENVPTDAGTRAFVDRTEQAGLLRGGWGMGCAVGDTDNDGDVDLYITYWGTNALYENLGDGRFLDITTRADVGDSGWGTSAVFVDLDEDGLLDLFVANYLNLDLAKPPGGGLPCSGWRGLDVYCGPHGMQPQANVLYHNEGANRFSDGSVRAGVAEDLQASLGVVTGDFDGDDDTDVYVANDGYPNTLYINDGAGRLTEAGALMGAAYSEDGRAQAGMGVTAGDYDRDGDLDLLITHFSDDVNTLYQNQGDGRFRDHTAAAGLSLSVRPFLGWGTGFFDADNDGWLDLFVANGHIYPQVDTHPSGYRYAQRNLLYHNLQGRFVEIGNDAGLQRQQVSRGTAFGDYDDDGDMDLVVVNLNDRLQLLHNLGNKENHWLGVRLLSRHGGRDAIGARVQLSTGAQLQSRQLQTSSGYLSQSDPRLLFGLGLESRVDSLVVQWPGGHRQVLRDLAVDRYHVIQEGQSTPVLGVHRQDPVQAPASAQPAAVATTEHAYQPPPGWTTQQHYEAAVQLHRQGRFEEASAALGWILAQDPGYLPAHYSLAVNLFSGMGRVMEARHVLEATVQLDSTRAEVFRLLGVVYLNQNEPRLATTVLERAVALTPDSFEDTSWLGLAYLRLGNLARAEQTFMEAARLAPWKPQPHMHLADLYERRADPERAAAHRRDFERLRPAEDAVDRDLRQLREFPTDAGVRYHLGLDYLAQGRYRDAAGTFETAIHMDSTVAAAYHGLGAAHHLQGDAAAAIPFYLRATQLDSTRLTALADLARACVEQRRFEQALRAYDRALRLDPSRLDLRSRRGYVLALTGHMDEGLLELERVLAVDGGRIDTRQSLAEVYTAAGRVADAIEQWQAVLRLDPNHKLAGARMARLQQRSAGG